MAKHTRYISLKSIYPIIIVYAVLIYIVALWSSELALALGLSAGLLLIVQVIAKAQHINVRMQDMVFKQYECLKQLYRHIDPSEPFPETRGYRGSPDFLLEIYNRIMHIKPNVIVEGSSGLSTLISAYALKKLGSGQVISLEHEEFYAGISQGNVDKHGLQDIARVVHTPIVKHAINSESWLWYDYSLASLPDEIDMIIIDGPPRRLQKNARYPALPLLIERLKVGGVLLLDDADRKAELVTVEKWKQQFNNIKVEYLPMEKGMVVVTKI